MKLIIDIPEEAYKQTQNDVYVIYDKMYGAIKNGKLLPKGHGRLIDADELIEKLEVIANDEWNKEVGSSKGLEDAIEIIDDTPTIIEADKEEET